MKKKPVYLTILVLLIVILCLSTIHPIVIRDFMISENSLYAIQGQASGLYSTRLPLVPILVHVDQISNGLVYYSIYFFPFGRVDMSYSAADGYHIEKPLTGL